MRQRFFTVRVFGGDAEAEALDRCVSSHRVTALDRHLVQDGHNSAWAICVEYADGEPSELARGKRAPRVDYKEVLGDEEFRRFSRLRELRKTIADIEGVPLYAIFTNEQLALMVQTGVDTASGLKAIEGIGAGKVEKYGARFLALLRGGSSDGSSE